MVASNLLEVLRFENTQNGDVVKKEIILSVVVLIGRKHFNNKQPNSHQLLLISHGDTLIN